MVEIVLETCTRVLTAGEFETLAQLKSRINYQIGL